MVAKCSVIKLEPYNAYGGCGGEYKLADYEEGGNPVWEHTSNDPSHHKIFKWGDSGWCWVCGYYDGQGAHAYIIGM